MPPGEFFSAGFWAFATALLAGVLTGIGYVVKRIHTLKDKRLEKREAEAATLNEKYIDKVRRTSRLETQLSAEQEARKLEQERCKHLEWELEQVMRDRGGR